jgi:hypothetical protein
MNKLTTTFSHLVIAICLLLPVAALAGRTCEAQKTTLQTLDRGLALAEKTRNALNASGEKVVILARAGQDLTKYGLRYSHLALAYQLPDGQGGNTWRVLHKLNDCGTSSSAIYRQGLGEFFLDDLWRYEAAWIAPSPEVQARLLTVIQSPVQAIQMHHKPYSIVSYAWGTKYQQSNQWAIETLALAMEPSITQASYNVADSRAKAQAWLQFKGYQPTALRIDGMTRLGGRISSANVAFDDHPSEKRFSDRIETVTVDSVFQWLQRSQLSTMNKAPTVIKL